MKHPSLLAVIIALLTLFSSAAEAQSSVFTYQGKLTDNGSAANGTYDLRFGIFELVSGNNPTPLTSLIVKEDVSVLGGIFTVELDFGAAGFHGGTANFLEISVRPGTSTGSFTVLAPRQPITSVPFAIKSLRAITSDSSDLAQSFTNPLLGDVGGGMNSTVVQGIQGRSVASSPPTASGQTLVWNATSSQWEPGTPTTGPGSPSYIQNRTTPQTSSSFNISDNGVVGGNFSVAGTITGNGSGITNLNPANISAGTAPINIAGAAAKTSAVTSGFTPSVAGLTTLVLNYASSQNITDLSGGVEGQCVTLIVGGQPMSIVTGSGSQFRLNGNWTGQLYDSLTVCRQQIGAVLTWIEKARSVNAPSANLNIGAGANGTVYIGADQFNTCNGNCTFETRVGTRKMLSAVPFPGYVFAGWSGSGCSGTDPCFITVNGTTGVSASFQPASHTLQIVKTGAAAGGLVTSTPSGINCGPTCTATYAQGTIVTLTASQDQTSTFSGWSVPGCGSSFFCQVTMDSSKTVTANFSITQVFLTAVRTGNGTGHVQSSPSGIDCGSNCLAGFNYGSTVVMVATPGANSYFSGWAGDQCTVLGPNTCVVTMFGAPSVSAIFGLNGTFRLQVNKFGSGSGYVGSGPVGIDCGPTCSAFYDADTVVTLRAEASPGSTFVNWIEGCSGTNPQCTVTMDQARTAAAVFNSN